MNHLTSTQRKLVYLAGIVILLPLIFWLGNPSSRDSSGELNEGGKLAQMRTTHQLGETSLGNVDPSSSTMNLVLLGFRGVATNLLWQKAIEQRDEKQWAGLRSTVQSIILLQPHYIKVWDFQGWNLAYNVSAEWDNVPDRWYWVKEGGKFFMRGTDRNNQNAMLAHKTGTVLSQKVGRSDEWSFFRKYFVDDPDEEMFGDGPDLDFNRGYNEPGPYGDNYEAARNWFIEANNRDTRFEQSALGMQRELFWSYPAHSYLEMANALQREGTFSEKSRDAWARGYNAWTREFGLHDFPSVIGNYHLEVIDPKEFEEIADRNSKELEVDITADMVRQLVARRQDTTNYRYWRARSAIEGRTETMQAHRNIYDGQQLYRDGELKQASEKILAGLTALETIFGDNPAFQQDDLIVEEALMAMFYLRTINRLEGISDNLPEDTPLYELWEAVQQSPSFEDLERQFRRDSES